MRIEVNINKGYFVILSGLLIILTGAILVYTYGGNQPNVVGHTGGEIESLHGQSSLMFPLVLLMTLTMIH